VLAALNFFGYGSYQLQIGHNVHLAISQASVSKSITDVTDAMNQPEVFRRFVMYPQNRRELDTICDQ